MKRKLSEIAAACGGRVLGEGDPLITGFATDSRACKAGMLFVPIRGENVDGHAYLPAAFAAGAAASFTDHPIEGAAGPLLLVSDPRAALQKTAAWYRAQFEIPIVGITGSVGKTTMKEMAAQALSAAFRVHKTAGNANSQVGVPITVCGLEKVHTAAVIEMGVSIPGEMARIAAVVKPTCAVMTNIGVSHIETMKSRENILREKAKIADYLPEDGVLFVNGDDDLLPALRESSLHRVLSFGLSPRCDWRATALKETERGTFFTAHCPSGDSREVFVPAFGEHNVRNALAAVAVAVQLDVLAEDAIRAIGAYKAPAMRQQLEQVNGLLLIDDSYNASPDSMRAALGVLCSRPVSGKRAAVLADMLELGDYAREGHRQVGRFAREQGVDLLLCVGEQAGEIAAGYGEGALCFSTKEEAISCLRAALRPGDAVLVKGSRGMHVDEVAAALRQPGFLPE